MMRLCVTVSHIVDVAPARNDVAGFGLVLADNGSNPIVAAVEQEAQVGAGQHAALGIGVESGANDGLLEHLVTFCVVAQVVDVVLVDDGDDDRDKARAPHRLAIDRVFVDATAGQIVWPGLSLPWKKR